MSLIGRTYARMLAVFEGFVRAADLAVRFVFPAQPPTLARPSQGALLIAVMAGHDPAVVGPRSAPGAAASSDFVPEPAERGPRDRNEGSPQALVTAGRHQVGFPEHLHAVNDVEHAQARASEAEARVVELEELLQRWVDTHHGQFSPKGPDSALIPATMLALGASRPLWTSSQWIDAEA